VSFPDIRLRRLRQSRAVRDLVRETSLEPRQLVLPLFVREGLSEPVAIGSMPGVAQHSIDSLRAAAVEAAEAGVGGVMLFGVPAVRDARGSGADDPQGILNVATEALAAEVGDALVVQTDLCLDEFTDHGHCGVLAADGSVDNDATLERYASMALAQARAPASARVDLGQPGPVIAPEVYGHFMEQLGSGIDGGIWVGPDSDIPNIRGYRRDVVEALQALEVPVVRWPGGCYADIYHWRDGIGPRAARPVRLNHWWGGTEEAHAFGTHEFFEFAELIGAKTYLSLNVGSGTVAELRTIDDPWLRDYFAARPSQEETMHGN
jgi:hypothetical protein